MEKYAIGSDRITSAYANYSDINNHLAFLNPFSLGKFNEFSQYYLLFFVLGFLLIILRKYYFLIFFIITQQILLFKFPLERYFLLSQIISTIIVAAGVGFFTYFKSYKAKKIIVIPLAIIVALSFISAAQTLTRSSELPDYSYGRYKPGRLVATAEAAEWVKNHSNENAVIITPRASVVSYHSKRRTLWLNQLAGKAIYEAFLGNDIDGIYKISKEYENTYLLIPEDWIVDGEAEGTWMSFVERKTIDLIDENPTKFKKKYSNNLVSVYQVI